MTLDKLQKALALFQKEYNDYLELTQKTLPGQPKEIRDFIESMLESLTLYNLSINRIKDGFAAFKVEYASQLHVPRFSVCMSNEDYDKQIARLKVAKEKNVEYAKLVAAQAEKYAEEKRDNVVVPRKQLEDIRDYIEAHGERVGFYGKGLYDVTIWLLGNLPLEVFYAEHVENKELLEGQK